jgi:hypothetical protein
LILLSLEFSALSFQFQFHSLKHCQYHMLTFLENNLLKYAFDESEKTHSGCNAFPSNAAPLILTISKIFLVREFLCQPDWYIQ